MVTDLIAVRQQAGDLLGCAWPAALDAAKRPLDSATWMAAIAVITQRCAGRPERLRRMGYERFLAAVQSQPVCTENGRFPLGVAVSYLRGD